MKMAGWKKLFRSMLAILLTCESLFAGVHAKHEHANDLTIIGGGIIGLFEAYYAHQDAKNAGKEISITILEKNPTLFDTTAANVFPSLTPDELLSVVPRGPNLLRFLQIPFSKGKGIRVDDVGNVNDSRVAKEFIDSAAQYGLDDQGHTERTKAILALGKMSMQRWQDLYDNADDEFKAILSASNFNPCHEQQLSSPKLQDGYRIDPIANDPDAKAKAQSMVADYLSLGYASTKILTPDEVVAIDPYLQHFVASNTITGPQTSLVWKDDASAIWRPGGCLNARKLLPQLVAYLEKSMGTYVDKSGQVQKRFSIQFNQEVTSVRFANDGTNGIAGLMLNGSKEPNIVTHSGQAKFVFAPGEAVGTLRKLGFTEPDYARFAGPSLHLEIPLNSEQIERYKNLRHCMEVHEEGVVLAWQAWFAEGKVNIGVAGTKAFYADQKPQLDEAFAKNRHLLQLNIINGIFPELISIIADRDTKGQRMEQKDLIEIVTKKFGKRWVGTRAVAYDGFPTLGKAHRNDGAVVPNARITTHLGSGGCSFALGAIEVSRSADVLGADEFVKSVLTFSNANRGQASRGQR